MANKLTNISMKKNNKTIEPLSFDSSESDDIGSTSRSIVKRRRAAGPPPRLEWPVAPISSSSSRIITSSSLKNNKLRHRQESRCSDVRDPQHQQDKKRNKKTNSGTSDNGYLMWVDKYAPTLSSDLCMAPKKIKEVKEWMMLSSSEDYYYNTTNKLLILTGGPGIGKTATVRVLAKELGFTILEWEDTSSSYTANINFLQQHNVPQSQLDSFQEFLSSSGCGFQTLSIVEHNTKNPFAPNTNDDNNNRALLLIEELPNLYNEDAGKRFRSIMSEHVRRSTSSPTILIFSAICEGSASSNSASSDLNKILDESLLYDPTFVKVINCNAVTKAKMKVCLTNILQKENKKRLLDDSLFESIWITSGGDIRSAINTLQFHCYNDNSYAITFNSQYRQEAHTKDIRLSSFHALGKLLYAKRQVISKGMDYDFASSKQFFNAPLIGGEKTCTSVDDTSLYQKKICRIDNRPPLVFDPEEVINQNELGPEGAIFFLSYHAIDFFEDETELCEALETFSQAALFLDKIYQREWRESIYPVQYLSSLASRAVADANKHPAPNRFRSLSAPKVFEVRRKQTDNARKLDRLCRRLSYQGDILPLESCVGSVQRLVIDSLPFVRLILPDEANYALSNMHSMANSSNQGRKGQQPDYNGRYEAKDEEYISYVEEQRQLLEMDDIVDEDDDNSVVSKRKDIPLQERQQSEDKEVIIID